MKKNMHKTGLIYRWSLGLGQAGFLWVLSLLLLSWPLPLFAHDNNTPLIDVISKVKPGVVAVGTMRPVKRTLAKNPPVVFKGSGFVVGSGRYVVTNLHVLPVDLDYESDETLAVFTGRGKQAKGIPAKIVRKDPLHDLALLELVEGRLPALDLASSGFISEGSEVAVTGFPIGMVLGLFPVTHRGIISAITPFVIPAVSSRSLSANQLRSLRNPFEVYQLDMVAYPGNSGSAVYDTSTGTVIAVVNSVFVKGAKESVMEHPSGITYAIPIKYVKELMKGLD